MLPFTEMAVEFRLPELSAEDITQRSTQKAMEEQKQMICEKLRELTEKTLAEHDIYPISADIELDIDDTGCIESISADILLPAGSGAAADEAAMIVRNTLGIACSVRTSSVR